MEINMRILMTVAMVLMLITSASAQAHDVESKGDKTREEIQKLGSCQESKARKIE